MSTTKIPVELVDPTGSTNGQALVSGGPTQIPAWGNVVNSADLANTTDPTKGSALVGYLLDAAGAVGRKLSSKLGEVISVGDFGADPTGSADSTVAIQAALNSGATGVSLGSKGKFLISNTLNVPSSVLFYAEAPDGNGSDTAKIFTVSGMTVPAVNLGSGAEIRNISLNGTATSLTTGAHGIVISSVNGATISGCFLNGFYNLVSLKNTAFYNTIKNTLFYAAINNQLDVDSATSQGVDLILESCRFLSSSGLHAFNCVGLGSLIMSNVQMSALNITGSCINLQSVASLFGGILATNCVFEVGTTSTAASLNIQGTGGTSPSQLRFVGCDINGGNNPSIQILNLTTSQFIGCGLGNSTGVGYLVKIAAGCNVNHTLFSDCSFDGQGFTCGSTGLIDLTISNPIVVSANTFIDFSAVTSSGIINNLDISAGQLGTNSNPVILPALPFAPILGLRTFDLYGSITAPTDGSLQWSQKDSGAYKKIIFYTSGYINNTATNQVFTYPVPFNPAETPIVSTNTTGLTITTTSTAMTIVSPNSPSAYAGYVEVNGV